MAKRHKNAVDIQDGGACNVSGVARALVEAADEARSEGVQPSECPAVRLIVHQLHSLTGGWSLDHAAGTWEALMNECRAKGQS